MWSSFGSRPAPAEIEVTVIGPGHGESIVVHLGDGEWLLVDSCVDTADDGRRAAPLKYLRALGVNVETAVKLIVVSHWDDDHVRGIAEVVEACTSAQFCCSTAFTAREFSSLVESISIGATATDGGNIGHFRRVLQLLGARGEPIVGAAPGRPLRRHPTITSWSPSDHDVMQFLQFVAQMHPKPGQSFRKAIPGSSNLTSVVLSIDWDETSVLLGADMETHVDNRRGWAAIVSVAEVVGFRRGCLVKVPHHGSHTGHDDRMWSKLLKPQPISVIAPFGRGQIDKRPPKSSDVRRVNHLSSANYLTARHVRSTMPKRDVAVTRSLREGMIRLTSQRTPLGIVRFRRPKDGEWRSDLFGSAVRVK